MAAVIVRHPQGPSIRLKIAPQGATIQATVVPVLIEAYRAVSAGRSVPP